MNRGIEAVAAGMIASQRWMDVVANNLANVNTTGFKQDGLAFNDAMLQELRAEGGRGAVLGSLGSGAVERGQSVDLSQGSIQSTGNLAHLAIQGRGMFGLLTDQGERVYTRAGEFKTQDGELVDSRGYKVLDDAGNPILVDADKPFVVSAEGDLQIDGQPGQRVGVFQAAFTRRADGLFEGPGATAIAPGEPDSPQVRQGALESSNVSTIHSMIDMIRLERAFELAQKSVQSQDELTQRLVQSLQDRS